MGGWALGTEKGAVACECGCAVQSCHARARGQSNNIAILLGWGTAGHRSESFLFVGAGGSSKRQL
eukprot:15419206-Alexandrium_andersonii.AAC.1